MSSFRVITNGASSLQVVDPPIWWVAAFFAVVCVVALLALLGWLKMRFFSKADGLVYLDGKVLATRSIGQSRSLPRIALVIALVIALGSGLAGWATSQTSALTLDRTAGTWSLDSGFGFTGRSLQSGSLDEIDHATLETDVGAERFVVVLCDGEQIGLGAFTDQGGQSEAVAAVNQFLRNADGAKAAIR